MRELSRFVWDHIIYDLSEKYHIKNVNFKKQFYMPESYKVQNLRYEIEDAI